MNIGYSYATVYFSGFMDNIWFFQGRQLKAGEIGTLMVLP